MSNSFEVIKKVIGVFNERYILFRAASVELQSAGGLDMFKICLFIKISFWISHDLQCSLFFQMRHNEEKFSVTKWKSLGTYDTSL